MTVMVVPVSGTTLSSNEVETLRSGEIVKKYYVGAYVDPSHPQVRHDPHMVERIEQRSQWNLRPNAPVVASGPIYQAVEDNALKNAMQQEHDIEMHKQQIANAEVQNQTAGLKQEIAELKTKMLAQSESDVKRLEEKIETFGAKLASLESAASSKATQPQAQKISVLERKIPSSSHQDVNPWEESLQEE
jgi:hypothetical protein